MFDPEEAHPWATSMIAAVAKEQGHAEAGTAAAASPAEQRPHQPWADAGPPAGQTALASKGAHKQADSPDKPFKGPMDRQLQRANAKGRAAGGGSAATGAPPPAQGSTSDRPGALPSFGNGRPAACAAAADDASRDSFAFQQHHSRGQRQLCADASEDGNSRDSFALGAGPPTSMAAVQDGSRDSFVGFGGLALRLDDDSRRPPLSPAAFPCSPRCSQRTPRRGPEGAADQAVTDAGGAVAGSTPAGALKGAAPHVALPSFLQRAVERLPAPADGGATPLRVSDDGNSEHGAQCGGGAPSPGGRRHNSSVVALPSPSQLDPAVLDSLPLAIKRELELAYGTPPLPTTGSADGKQELDVCICNV